MDISRKKFVIATHHLVYGAPQALREYLCNKKINKLLYIAHPLVVDDSKSFCENLESGLVKKRTTSPLRFRVSLLNYFLEPMLTVWWCYRSRDKYDVFVGVDSLNAATGLFLKKIGLVNKVIYYTIDYCPKRFNNKMLNELYHWFDKYCLGRADETWNVSSRIAEGREQVRGLNQTTYNRQHIVPIGVWYDKVKRVPFHELKKHQLIFLGHLLEKQGVQIVLAAIPSIVKKIPDFHFLIVGGGEFEESLKAKARELHIESHVTFAGWIKERYQLDTVMADSALAIAMYDKTTDTFTYYADPTKLKDYLSAGLPILLTDVPHNAREIEKRGCGLIIDYNPERIADAVITLLADERRLQGFRKNALIYAREFDWNIVFSTALNV